MPTTCRRRLSVAAWCALVAGCQQPALGPQAPPVYSAPPPPGTIATGLEATPVATLGDPGVAAASVIHVPVVDRDWAWEQIVDVVDDYFRIEQERQVQLIGQVLAEGRIDTYPQVGATIVEPHRRDSVGRYNRWESTFQTIRRRATLRVIPDQTGYLVDVTVDKELEDLPQPESASAGMASFRNDDSLSSPRDETVSRTRLSPYWIPLGRDPALEQRILSEIQERLTSPAP
ncbi:MAG: hypothetical protein KF688_02950 [Pirellulales bacterium]|nr:hypothetical protein [Pirellulales bacterium]